MPFVSLPEAASPDDVLAELGLGRESKLYHYTSAETLFEHVLRTGALRLGPFDGVNDPRESKRWEPALRYEHPSSPSSSDLKAARSAWDSQTRGQAKLLCLSMDATVAGLPSDDADYFRQGWGKPRMWATYGAAHRGVCLELDAHELVRSTLRLLPDQRDLFVGVVQYVNRPLLVDEAGDSIPLSYAEMIGASHSEYIQRKLKALCGQLFFTKSVDWESEAEFRIVALSNQDCAYIDFSESISTVYVGEDFEYPIQSLMTALDTASLSQVAVKSLDWRGGQPLIGTTFRP